MYYSHTHIFTLISPNISSSISDLLVEFLSIDIYRLIFRNFLRFWILLNTNKMHFLLYYIYIVQNAYPYYKINIHMCIHMHVYIYI